MRPVLKVIRKTGAGCEQRLLPGCTMDARENFFPRFP